MNEKHNDYNLLEERWIPVLWADGKTSREGIKKVLTHAAHIRQIAASNPMDRVAILRFLLALLYWCRGNPPDDLNIASRDGFAPESFSKLDENRDCFNLLGQGKRFYQDGGALRRRPATDLIQEIPTGNNFWHFRHSTDDQEGLCRACCALGLLRLPLFCVVCLSGPGQPHLRPGINGAPPVYVVPRGPTLLRTLSANWGACSALGVPAWVQPETRPSPGEDVPLLTGLTLLPRRIWLHQPAKQLGVCIACGSREEPLIRTCEFQTTGENENEQWDDPHVVYSDRTPRTAFRAPDLTAAGRFRMDRPWQALHARMVRIGRFDAHSQFTSLFMVAFATDKAKNIDVWERTVPIRSRESSHTAAASFVQQWGDRGRWVEKDVRKRAVGGPAGAASVASIRPDIEHRVSAGVGDLLIGGESAWEEAANEYRPMMNMIARSLAPGFTVAALKRRKAIESIRPNMKLKTDRKKKACKEEGDQE